MDGVMLLNPSIERDRIDINFERTDMLKVIDHIPTRILLLGEKAGLNI